MKAPTVTRIASAVAKQILHQDPLKSDADVAVMLRIPQR